MQNWQKVAIALLLTYITLIWFWLQMPPAVTEKDLGIERNACLLELKPIPTNEPTKTPTIEPERPVEGTTKVGGIGDERAEKIRIFFCKRYSLPLCGFEEVAVAAADRYGLPYSLVVSIGFLESTGGKFARGNNYFGFGDPSYNDLGLSVSDWIYRVSEALGGKGPSGHYYAGKTTEEKLRVYNSVAKDYPQKVMSIMREIEEEK